MTELTWDYDMFIYVMRLIAVAMGAGISAILMLIAREAKAFRQRGDRSIFMGIIIYTLSVTLITVSIVATRVPTPGSIIYVAYVISFAFLYRGVLTKWATIRQESRAIPEESDI